MKHKTRKNRRILVLFLCLGLLLTGCGGSGNFRVGTGDKGGTYYSYTERMAGLLTKGFSFDLKTTAGSAANLRLLQKGFLDLAVVQSDILVQAEKREGDFADNDFANGTHYGAVAGLYTEALQIVVRKDKNIETPADLRGCSISIGEKESGIRKNATEMLRMAGISDKDYMKEELSISDSVKAMRAGRIDAFFCMAGAPTAAVAELAKDTEIRILSLDEEYIRIVGNLYPYYRECTIPAGTYTGQTEDIRTIGVRAVLVASTRLGKDEIRKLTEQVLTHSGELNQSIVTDGELTPAAAVDLVPIDFHPGAAAYLKDQGMDVAVQNSDGGEALFGGQDDKGGGK